MDRSRWLMAAVCVAGWVGLYWGLSFFFESLMAENYPPRLAAEPVANMPPPVDMAAVQRNWPNSLNQPQDRARLRAYLGKLEREAPLQSIAPRAPVQPVIQDLGTLLLQADPHAGQQKARVCMSCHDFAQGGPDLVGPNLWGVVGRDIASRPGFSYSEAMSAQAGAWSYQRLFDYLESPARAVPGNKMGFAGLRRPEDRAAVVRYLATVTPNPPPLPQPRNPE